MIGDSNFDIEAGRAAGVRTVAVSYGYRGRDFLKDADVIISSFEELPGAIEAGSGR
jgi:phosphoglycolate phosphatase